MASSLPTLSLKKYANLLMVNRVTENELEIKLGKIRRDHAKFKHDQRIRESQIWNELFENDRDLKKSVATSADKLRQDLTDRETLKVLCATAEKRRGLSVIDKPNALLERNKEFLAFKAQVSSRLYKSHVTRQLTFADRYRREINARKNQRSYERIVQRYRQDSEVKRPGVIGESQGH